MFNFIKNLFISIPIFLILQSISVAEVINKLNFVGNERIANETMVVFGDIVLGKNYEVSDVSLLIKKLYETNFFITQKMYFRNLSFLTFVNIKN